MSLGWLENLKRYLDRDPLYDEDLHFSISLLSRAERLLQDVQNEGILKGDWHRYVDFAEWLDDLEAGPR